VKSKVISLEAQLVEKGNKLSRTETELKDTKAKLTEITSKSSTAKSSGLGKAPTALDTAAQHVGQGDLAVEVDPAGN
jgi:hypothetical protein